LVQLVGPKGASAILILIWFDGVLCTGVCVLSAQRITYAIARDGVLPFSKTFSKLGKNHLPINAALIVALLSIAINAAVIGSTVAFSAITAAATIGTNLSYLIPIVARHTVGRKDFVPAKWNLGKLSAPIALVASCYICFLAVILMLPQLYPVASVGLLKSG
jgi:amino acid transporter